MSPILTSQGMVLATAMAISGTVLLLAFRLQKSPPPTGFSLLVSPIPPDQSPDPLPQSCISDSTPTSPSPSTSPSSDGKKKDKKKKRVHFAADVVDPIGNSDEYRKNFHHNNNRAAASNNNLNSSSSSAANHNYGGKAGGMPANRAALYNGILRDRVLHRATYSY